MSGFTFGSLFAGIGGIDLGFERCGMECKWQVEINDYAQKVLAKHWPKVHREKDIRECSTRNLERVDIIAGGFPCQDISYAGLGAGLDGERSGLFFEAIRLVRELQPRAVVLENVAALLTRGLDRVLGTLAEVGYDAEWHCIPAAYVGAPHIRDRVFVLAYAKSVGDSKRQQSSKRTNEAKPCRAERINLDGGCCRAKDVADTNCERLPWSWIPEIGTKEVYDASGCCWWNESSSRGPGTRKVEVLADTDFPHAQGQRQEPIGIESEQRNASDERWWAIEPDVGRVAHGIPARVDRLRGLGNAVVPQVAELVGRMVIERLKRI
jgi:DNA (cytosine-5)-methyltransferase 1